MDTMTAFFYLRPVNLTNDVKDYVLSDRLNTDNWQDKWDLVLKLCIPLLAQTAGD